jgi:hypothetical protein
MHAALVTRHRVINRHNNADSLQKLFCYVRDDPSSHTFIININEDGTVDEPELRDTIKEKKKPQFGDVRFCYGPMEVTSK